MALHVVCRNGHSLNVNDSLAGKSGLCPVCKVQVQVPLVEDDGMSEDAIMDILGPKQGNSSSDGVDGKSSASGAAKEKIPGLQSSPMKTCVKCKKPMDVGVHICPHCRCYVGGAGTRR
jgi:hypothetical protein